MSVICDVNLRMEIVSKGKELVKKYDPEVIAKKYYSVYQRVTGRNGN
jgi:glycosyltransferase involved in cell wall biosynthesis